ncbi:MAG: hypothetical protein ACO3P1_14875, partial [Pseudomonadales bacterium]
LSLNDPQGLGLNQSWFLLFKITTGEAVNELYGWLGFQSFVPSAGAYQGSYVQFTAWGLDSSRAEILAGQAPTPTPWTLVSAALCLMLLTRLTPKRAPA